MSLEQTMKWANEKIKEQAVENGKLQQRIAELEQSLSKRIAGECSCPHSTGSSTHFPSCPMIYKDRIAELEAQSQWVSVEDRLPETKCIALYKNSLGKPRMVMAEYIKKHTLEASPDCDGEGVSEYCEEKDIYYYTEGWWEIIENWDEYNFIVIHKGEITHWQHLPECPTQVFGGE